MWQRPNPAALLLAAVACAVAPAAAFVTAAGAVAATTTTAATTVATATTTLLRCADDQDQCCCAKKDECGAAQNQFLKNECSRANECVGCHGIEFLSALATLDCPDQTGLRSVPVHVAPANPPPPPPPAALTPQMGGSMTIDDTESTESSSAWQDWHTALVAGGVTIMGLGGVTCHCREGVPVHWNDTAKPFSVDDTPLRLPPPVDDLKTDVIEEMNLL